MPADAAAAWAAARKLDHATTFVDESHFMVTLRGCGECGQRFVHVFAEQIDWRDGEDPQWRALAPVSMAEAVGLAGLDAAALERAFSALSPPRPCLVSWWASDGEKSEYWAETPVPIMPHD